MGRTLGLQAGGERADHPPPPVVLGEKESQLPPYPQWLCL